MNKILEFTSDIAFRKWLEENRYTKDDNFVSVWTNEGKCVAATFEKHENGGRAWKVVMY